MIKGYKETSFGMIPKDWKVSKIEEIADVKGGKRLPKGESLIEEETNHPYIRVADMFFGGVNITNLLYVPEHVFPVIKNYIIGKDDLFISVAGTLGIVGEIPIELDGANLTENADKLTNISINKSFLLQVLLSPIFQNAVQREQTNNAQPKLALSRIRTFEVPNPPLPEQQKIAEILSTVDDKIEVIDQQIIETQELKKGLMQRLLSKGIGHTKFKESPLGKIPENWVVEKLGKVTTSFAGGTPKRGVEGYYGGSIPWIKSGEVNSNSIKGAEEHITELALKESSAKLIKVDSILVAMYGATAGKVGILKVSACSNQAVLAISSKVSAITNEYLYHYLKKNTIELLNLCQGSGQPNLSKGIVDSLQVPIPSIPEQQKISQILNSVDNKLEILLEKKTHYQELKQGLMQQLLTGKIRVKV